MTAAKGYPITPELVQAEAARLSTAHPEEILRWALETYTPNIALTCSFSGGGVVLAHMIAHLSPKTPVVFLDTGYHFPETLTFKADFVRRYNLNVVDLHPALTIQEQEAQYGPDLHRHDPDRCCQLRKVEPLMAALEHLDGWITALRRDQSASRAGVDVLEYHETPGGRPLVKVLPLARWTRSELWSYILDHRIPYHPLLDQGYKSIGCWPCTRKVDAHEPERAGRWSGTGKQECGLHTFTRHRD